jgi:predicted esterase
MANGSRALDVRRMRSCRFALVLTLSGVSLVAQTVPRAGRVDERVVAVNDSTQSYAQFLPPAYRADRRWPVLFVLDPRGRALHALRLFADGAERHGFVVVSSYNTLSDGAREPNVAAMNAMLESAQTRLSIDPDRIYLAGFSGTARIIWDFALEMRGHVAGIIGVGAGIPFVGNGPELAFAGDSTFAYFGGSGVDDFNYEEVRALGERFRIARTPYRLVVYPGPHDWPPAAVCELALAWLEARAMLGGRVGADSALLRTYRAADLDSARALEARGRLADAEDLYDAIARDYPGAPEASIAAERASALHRTEAVMRYRERARGFARADQEQAVELQRALAWADAQATAPGPALLGKLHIEALRAQAASPDSLASASARRMLSRTAVFLSFYAPRTYLARGAPDRALLMLRTAASIAPLRGEACGLLDRAIALSALHSDDDARLCAARVENR